MLLIKNGLVVDETSASVRDILIDGTKIIRVQKDLNVTEGTKVIDATGKVVLPGLIDAHTHYHLVSRGTVTCDSFPQGSRLAVFGGVTTVVDFADHNRGQSLVESTEYRLNEMKDGMAIDYSLHQGVYGHGYNSTIAKQLEDLKNKGVRTLKIFTTYRNVGYLIENREQLSDLFKNAKRLGMLVTAHCEFNPLIEEISDNWKGDFSPKSHADLRPSEAEGKAIEYFGELALEQDCPLYVVHVSSECGLNAIRNLRKKGLTVYAETTPHYLFLDRSCLETKDASLYVMTPPLREKKDNEALQKAILTGEIQVVASDHCAFTRAQKLESSDCRTVFPGIPGTEEIFFLINSFREKHSSEFSLCDMVKLLSTNPAKIFGLYPQKGSLEIGSDADLMIFDPGVKWVLEDDNVHSASNYTPYRGFEVTGKVTTTILRGDIVLSGDNYCGKPGEGRFIPQR